MKRYASGSDQLRIAPIMGTLAQTTEVQNNLIQVLLIQILMSQQAVNHSGG